jgi:hypothetical protein
MASAVNPIIARQLVEKLAAAKQGGGMPGLGGPGGPGEQGGPNAPGSPGGDMGQMVASQSAELNGADPQFMLKTVQQMKGAIVAMYVRASFQVPGAARHLAQAQKSLDAAIKELQQAAATANTVQPPPIANRAAMPNPAEVGSGGVGQIGGGPAGI